MASEPERERDSGRYEPSARIARLRARVLGHAPELSADAWYRAYCYMEGWMAAKGEPLPLRNAAALANVIEKMPVTMVAGELLVGEHANTNELISYSPTPPEGYRRRIAQSPLTAEQAEQLTAWLEAEPFEWQRLAPVAPVPEAQRRAQERGVIEVWGADLNHSVRGYEKLLRIGFSGLRAELEAALQAVELADPMAPARRANLLGWLRICEAARGLGKRHAAAARELAASCTEPAQAAEWEQIAAVCERVPEGPAGSFREALQALWFGHMLTVWEDGVNANSIGRIDQMLWPYLERDLAAGRLTWDEAGELLAALWIKLYQGYDVQQMMVGGQTPAGADAVNPLSYLVLEVTEGLGFVRCLSARLHRGSPRAFVVRCLDLVARGGGIPFFFNDETLIPALVANGIPVEEARDYAAIGCIEITIPGRANPHAVSHWVNLLKCLELAINDGRDMLSGEQLGPRTGTLCEQPDMNAVLAAYRAQVAHFAELAVYGSNALELAHRAQFRLPYLSLLTEDCIARGQDIIEGGARYNYHSCAAMGIPNVADSLAALDVAVFSEQKVSAGELLAALRSDFAGAEELVQYLRNRVPKYGNDQALPDGYAATITRDYCELMGKHRTPTGGRYLCHLFTFTLMLPFGARTGATPEGRRAGEPLAYSVSPNQGRDREGFTAVLNSLSRLPHHLAAASSSAILEAHPSLLEGGGKQAFVDLIVTAIASGVGQMQINVVSAETLRAAQQDRERYRSLCVRVSGFSQQFVTLEPAMQEHIIARTKHGR